MTFLTFLAGWAIRSALLVAAAAVMLKAFRVQNPFVRLAAWMIVLVGSSLIPAASALLPGLEIPLVSTFRPVPARKAPGAWLPVSHSAVTSSSASLAPKPPKLWSWIEGLYLLGASLLLVRLVTGLILSRRIIARSVPTSLVLPTGSPIHESSEMSAPATLGVTSPIVLLPSDWREWEPAKLTAILAHEESHIRRRDPAVQFLSSIHRALLWIAPTSWFLNSQLVRVAEEASDDAALAAAEDRVSYAEVLFHFMQRAAGPAGWEGVAMARYGKADHRIHRILDGTHISRRLTRPGWIATVTLAAPVVYLAAAVHPVSQTATRGEAIALRIPAMAAFSSYVAADQSATASTGTGSSSGGTSATASSRDDAEPQRRNQTRYLIVSGNSTTGMYDSRDRLPLDDWRSRFGAHFVWFRQDGTDYIATDQRVLDDLEIAMAPQRDVNRMQGEVNRQQGEVNRHQGQVNEEQGRVNTMQGEVNRLQGEVNERQRQGKSDESGQSQVNARQAEVNVQQQVVNDQQDRVNQEQRPVNEAQEKVNAEQRRIGPRVEDAIQGVLESAVLKGLAHGIAR